MRTWMVPAVCVALFATNSFAGVAVTGLGMDEEFQFRVGLTQTTTEVGLFGQYSEELTLEEDDRYGGGVYATIDVVGDPNSLLGAFEPLGEIDTKFYIGVLAGWAEGDDGIGALILGAQLGPIVVEYQHRPDSGMFTALPDDTEDKFLIGAQLEF